MLSESSLDQFLNEYFPGIKLESPLFYQARVGIRFELGGDIDGKERKFQVYHRVSNIFKALYEPRDEIFVVASAWAWHKKRDPVDTFSRAVKNREVLRRLHCNEMPIDDDDADRLDDALAAPLGRKGLEAMRAEISPESTLYDAYNHLT